MLRKIVPLVLLAVPLAVIAQQPPRLDPLPPPPPPPPGSEADVSEAPVRITPENYPHLLQAIKFSLVQPLH